MTPVYWSSTIPAPTAAAAAGGGAACCRGPTDSLHAATRKAAAASPARLCILERSDVEGSTLRAEHVRGADHQCVAVPQLVDAQIRERRHAVDGRHRLCAGQRAGEDRAAVVADGDSHRSVEAGYPVAS